MSSDGEEEIWETLGLGAFCNSREAPSGDLVTESEVKEALKELRSDTLQGTGSNKTQVDFSVRSESTYLNAEREAVEAYERQAGNLKDLEGEAQVQEEELSGMANDVSALMRRLEGVPIEVDKLRRQTQKFAEKIGVQSDNEACLGAFVDSMLLSPALIRHVVDGEVGDGKYGHCLEELQRKIAQYEVDDAKSAASYGDLRPILDKTVLKAVYKVKRFLLKNIALLTVPNTNVHIIKETVLLKHRNLMEFIQDTSPQSFLQVRSAYVDVMSQIYEELFRKYSSGLIPLKSNSNTGSITLTEIAYVGNDSQRPSSTNGGTLGKSSSPASESFETRLQALRKPDAPAIVLPVAVANGKRFFYEEIHRSMGKMLTDTCTTEHRFCAHFFGDTYGRMFTVFFKRVVDTLLEVVTGHVIGSKDAIGALLALKITEAQRSAMQKRNISDLSDYFIRVDVLLKPHFKSLFDENVELLTLAKKDVRNLFRGESDTRPYPVTRRFAQFSSSILVLSTFGGTDKTIVQSLKRLRIAFNDLLSCLSNAFTKPRSRGTFLINNLDLILGTYGSRKLHSTEDYSYFSSLLTAHIAAFVELELSAHFPDLQGLLRHSKSQKLSSERRASPSEKRVQAILREFSKNWQVAVAHVKQGILLSFPNFVLGDEILRAVLAALLTLHKRTEALIQNRYESLMPELVAKSALTEVIASMRKALP